MAIWISSDWHCKPGELREGVEEWIQLGKQGNHRLIGGGDLFDLLPLGKKKWNDAASIEQLATVLAGHSFDYVSGNHDPYKTMKGLVAAYPNIKLHKRLEFEDGGRRYLVTHGHRWAVDWGFLGLRHIAPPLVEFLANSRLSGLWYRFCRWQGWLAHPDSDTKPPGKESQQITKLTRIIWAGGSEHALNNDCCVILGHTHTTGKRERGKSREQPSETYMADDGNLPDGSYVEITGKDVELRFLPA